MTDRLRFGVWQRRDGNKQPRYHRFTDATGEKLCERCNGSSHYMEAAISPAALYWVHYDLQQGRTYWHDHCATQVLAKLGITPPAVLSGSSGLDDSTGASVPDAEPTSQTLGDGPKVGDPCPECEGSGTYMEHHGPGLDEPLSCHHCRGTGVVPEDAPDYTRFDPTRKWPPDPMKGN